jgi:hypothetical protein
VHCLARVHRHVSHTGSGRRRRLGRRALAHQSPCSPSRWSGRRRWGSTASSPRVFSESTAREPDRSRFRWRDPRVLSPEDLTLLRLLCFECTESRHQLRANPGGLLSCSGRTKVGRTYVDPPRVEPLLGDCPTHRASTAQPRGSTGVVVLMPMCAPTHYDPARFALQGLAMLRPLARGATQAVSSYEPVISSSLGASGGPGRIVVFPSRSL